VARRVVIVSGEGEAQGRYAKQTSGPGLFGVVRLRASPGEVDRPRVIVENALPAGDEANEFFSGMVQGVERAAREASLFSARVAIVGAVVHEVDSSSLAFAGAGRLALLEALRVAGTRSIEVDEALYPKVRTVSSGVRLVTEGIDVEILPAEEPRDACANCATNWATFDHELKPVMQAKMARLAGESSPWVDFLVVLRGGVETGRGANAEALRRAIDAAIEASGPIERARLGPEIVVREQGSIKR
jgi:hypothetical protein